MSLKEEIAEVIKEIKKQQNLVDVLSEVADKIEDPKRLEVMKKQLRQMQDLIDLTKEIVDIAEKEE